jgi:prepilin-type N-terminal cleavage/methylation domain-containing protein
VKELKIKRILAQKKFLKIKPGFSLIELLVSIAIIVAITGLFFASYRTANKQAELVRSVSDLSSSYRKALNQSLGLSESDGAISEGGWGVHIDLRSDTSKYYIFADKNNDGKFNDGEASEINGGETVNTPRDVSIDSISALNSLGTSISLEYLDILYIPPHPTIIFYSPDTTYPLIEAEITMINSKTGNTKAVEVNFVGLIDMID